MIRSEAVQVIKRAIRMQFDTKKDAAAHLGISVQHLSRIIDHGHPIPEHILEYAGLEKVVTETYIKTRKPK